MTILKDRHVKGINLLNGWYHVKETSIPITFELIRNPVYKKGKSYD
jgi:hypothetical protein